VAVEAAIVAGFDPDIESLGSRLALQTALAATLIGVAFIAARPGPGLAEPPALGLRRPLAPAIKVSALAYVAYIGAAIVIAALLEPEQEDVTRDLGFGEGDFGSIAAGLLIVVVAPVSEEIFFRGFLFGGLRRGTSFVVAALVSSGIWGLFHYTGPGSWGVVVQLTVFGLALAWVYERTGSLWPPIALHVLNNALAFAVLTS
jgi:membrane protease YdiL (CAAX protease family)